MGGTFNVARSIWEHPVFAHGEFSEREAFLWLVSEAAWKPRTVRVASYVTDLERGQLCASVRFMAEAWGWSKSRVARFLAKLRESGMIKNRDSSGTAPLVITICNYDKFQGLRDSGETKSGQRRDSSGTNEKKDNPREEINTPLTPRRRGGFSQISGRKGLPKSKGQSLVEALQEGRRVLIEHYARDDVAIRQAMELGVTEAELRGAGIDPPRTFPRIVRAVA